jgi:hypothetical protein
MRAKHPLLAYPVTWGSAGDDAPLEYSVTCPELGLCSAVEPVDDAEGDCCGDHVRGHVVLLVVGGQSNAAQEWQLPRRCLWPQERARAMVMPRPCSDAAAVFVGWTRIGIGVWCCGRPRLHRQVRASTGNSPSPHTLAPSPATTRLRWRSDDAPRPPDQATDGTAPARPERSCGHRTAQARPGNKGREEPRPQATGTMDTIRAARPRKEGGRP